MKRIITIEELKANGKFVKTFDEAVAFVKEAELIDFSVNIVSVHFSDDKFYVTIFPFYAMNAVRTDMYSLTKEIEG